jgi:hypothetical protein
MTKPACPGEASLLRFVDDDLSHEELERVRGHLLGCQSCRDQERALRQLPADLHAPLPAQLDVAAHVRDVMAAVAARGPGKLERPRRLASQAAATALAAGVLLSIGYWGSRSHAPLGDFQARGGGVSTIARDVGVQLYTQGTVLRPLPPGAALPADAALTAGFRNLSARPVSLLLFAVDARNSVHWISPRYSDAQSDPLATVLPVSADERVLPTTVVFDDVATGALRVIAVISAAPSHVSDIESLAATSLNPRDITRRLPEAEVRETVLRVDASEGSQTP